MLDSVLNGNNRGASIGERILQIREAIADCAMRAGRVPEEISLLAVTKFVDEARIMEAGNAGLHLVGENRVQEFVAKQPFFVQNGFMPHFIGQLQTNKVKYIIGQVGLIQSVDRINLAEEISRQAVAHQLVQDILLEVNIGEEPQKGGVFPQELDSVIEVISTLPGICVKGFMCVPPAVGESGSHVYFAKMRKLFDTYAATETERFKMEHLSMGMSGDYKAAIAEGTTMIRLGTAIFGARTITA